MIYIKKIIFQFWNIFLYSFCILKKSLHNLGVRRVCSVVYCLLKSYLGRDGLQVGVPVFGYGTFRDGLLSFGRPSLSRWI
jgi:hypothetical protein